MTRQTKSASPHVAVAAACAAALMFAAPPSALAVPLDLQCPASIPETSVQLTNTPAGWTTFVGAPLYLHGAAPMSSPPEMLGELADFTQKKRKNEWIYTYQIDGKFPNGKWLACTYGESDQLTLAQRLPDDTSVCTFVFRKGKYVGQNDITIRCK